MSELVEEFRDVARFDVDDGGMSQTYRGRYVEYIHFAVLLDHIERLEVNQWQPIEDAPKGHELFLLYEPHEVGGFLFVGTRNIDGDWINNIDGERQKPTHWMPLPTAPNMQKEED